MKEIIPSVFTFTGLIMGRVYAIQDSDGFTVIDASINGAGAKIIRQIEAAGYQASDIKRVLLTHAHPDHVGGLPYLIEHTGAKLYTSTIEALVVEGKAPVVRPPLPIKLPETLYEAIAVDVQLEDGAVISEVMGGLNAILSPGHSPGHLAFWQPEKRLLFAGDVMFHILGITQPIPFFTPSMAQNRQSILLLAELQPEIICFGHGEPIVANASAQLQQFADKIRQRVQADKQAERET